LIVVNATYVTLRSNEIETKVMVEKKNGKLYFMIGITWVITKRLLTKLPTIN